MAAARNDRGGYSEVHRKRRARNIALMVALIAWVVIIYVVSVVKMGGGS